MKKIVVLLLALVMVMSLVGCGSSDEPAAAATEEKTEAKAEAAPAEEAGEDVPVIAFCPKVIGQAWWDYVRDGGVMEWAEETGMDVIYKGPTEIDAAAQVQIMTDLVAQDIDILCFSPLDPDACENICKEAREKGIIVIATEASGMTNVDYDVEAFNEAGFGGFLMDQLAAQMGEEGEYITMVGSMTQESHNNWTDAAVARQLEAYPNMTLVPDERVSSESDAEVAYQKTKELIKKYPNLKGICGSSSFDAPGAARAIKELGLEGQFFAIGGTIPSEVRDYLHEGVLLGGALWDPAISAKAMLNLAMKMYNGEEIGDTVDCGIEGYTNCTVEGTVVTGSGMIAITKENVDDFTF